MTKDTDIDVLAQTQNASSVYGQNSQGPHTLASLMKVSLVVNERSEAVLLHDQQFPFLINWAEYDSELQKLYLISFNGVPIELGLDIPEALGKKLIQNDQFCTALLQNNTLVDFYFVPLIVRETFYN